MSLFCRGKEISVTHKNFLFVGWDSLSVVYLASESGCRSGDEGRRGSQSLVWGLRVCGSVGVYDGDDESCSRRERTRAVNTFVPILSFSCFSSSPVYALFFIPCSSGRQESRSFSLSKGCRARNQLRKETRSRGSPCGPTHAQSNSFCPTSSLF